MKLTAKQEAFCVAYMTADNASDAYRAAYNTSKMKMESVNRLAFSLLQDIKITSRIAELRAQCAEKAGVTVVEWLKESWRLSRSDVRNILHPDGKLKMLHELDDETAAAIASVKINAAGDVEYKFWDKNSALEKVGRHLGAFAKDNKQKTDPLTDLLAALPGAVMDVKKEPNDDDGD